MNFTRDIQTLSEFRQNASKMVKQLSETRQPIVLTVNGKVAAVVQDPDSYRQMADDAEYLDNVKELKKRMDYVKNGGELIPADEVFDRISKKFGIAFD